MKRKILTIIIGAVLVSAVTVNAAGVNTITQLQTYFAKVSSGDTTPGYLFSKLVAGANITLTKNNPGANETITISSTGGGGGGGGAFSTTSIIGLATTTFNFSTTSSGNDFSISSSSLGIFFNLPSASATARGLITTLAQTIAGIKTFASTTISGDTGGIYLGAPTTGNGTIGFNSNPDNNYTAGVTGYGQLFQHQVASGNFNIYVESNVSAGSPHTHTGVMGWDNTGLVTILQSVLGTTTLGGMVKDGLGNAGTAGQILQTNSMGVRWVATSSLGLPAGTVTSVSAINNALGITVSSTTCTTACMLGFSLTGGYVIPLIASTTEWAIAYASSSAASIRAQFSNTVTGLTYNSGTGVTSQTAGYNIPLTASTTQWANTTASNTLDVTLAGTPNYLTISGQTITRALINLTSHVTGVLPIANGGIATTTAPSLGQVLIGNASGGYDLKATSSLGFPPALTGGVAGRNSYWVNSSTLGSGSMVDGVSASGVNASNTLFSFLIQASSTQSPLNVTSSAGVPWFTVNSNSFVGIGTTTPVETLQLFSTNNAGCDPSIGIGGNMSGDTDFTICRDNNNDSTDNDSLTFYKGLAVNRSTSTLTAFLTLGSTGNIGIGTTTPTQKLTVNGTVQITGGSPALGSVLSSNASGIASWTATSSLGLGASLTGGAFGYGTRWLTATTLGTSTLIDNGVVTGINATSSTISFNVRGIAGTNDIFNVASSSNTSVFKILANGNIGIGSSTPAFSFAVGNTFSVSTTSTGNLLEVASSTNGIMFGLASSGHVITTAGATPTVTSCGTSPSVVGTDHSGTITTGTAAPAACTLNFGVASATTPVCTFTVFSSVSFPTGYTPSTSGFTINFVTGLSSGKITYICEDK